MRENSYRHSSLTVLALIAGPLKLYEARPFLSCEQPQYIFRDSRGFSLFKVGLYVIALISTYTAGGNPVEKKREEFSKLIVRERTKSGINYTQPAKSSDRSYSRASAESVFVEIYQSHAGQSKRARRIWEGASLLFMAMTFRKAPSEKRYTRPHVYISGSKRDIRVDGTQ